jgi:hypothetical protein
MPGAPVLNPSPQRLGVVLGLPGPHLWANKAPCKCPHPSPQCLSCPPLHPDPLQDRQSGGGQSASPPELGDPRRCERTRTKPTPRCVRRDRDTHTPARPPVPPALWRATLCPPSGSMPAKPLCGVGQLLHARLSNKETPAALPGGAGAETGVGHTLDGEVGDGPASRRCWL